jgi:putative ABC transport system permease protein
MPTLTWDDLEAIQTELSSVKAAAPQLRTNAQIISDEQNWTTSITGTTPEYFEIRSWPMASGAGISQADVDTGTKVVVLGQTVAEKLFGRSADPVGQSVRIRNIPFQIVGVAERKGQSGMGQDNDDVAFIPATTFASKIQGGLGKFINGTVFVAAASAEATTRAQQDITNLLRERHHIEPGGEDDFSIRNLADLAEARMEGTNTMTTLLASIAAVSLLVGGIGIMNIMLVSVTERTREIGLRMAVGAKARHILAQFLIEALTLALAGGVLGMALGISAAAWLAQRFDWPVLFQPGVVLLSVVFSAAVGMGFGLYPAWKASQLDPIAALRYE